MAYEVVTQKSEITAITQKNTEPLETFTDRSIEGHLPTSSGTKESERDTSDARRMRG